MNFKRVPLYLEALYQLAYLAVFRKLKERLGFDRMRVAYSGAAPISPDVLHFFQSIGVNLIEGYGQTEGTGVTCVSRVGRVKFGTVGPPLSGTEVRIAEDGEILVKSPGVFKGYYKNPEATAETIKDGWLYSGDVGELDEDGYLKITDRKKDIIVTAGGKNITPQYIENKLKFSPYINDAVVIGDKRKFISALVMIDEDNVVKYRPGQQDPVFHLQGPDPESGDQPSDPARGGQGQRDAVAGGADQEVHHPPEEALRRGRGGDAHHEGQEKVCQRGLQRSDRGDVQKGLRVQGSRCRVQGSG